MKKKIFDIIQIGDTSNIISRLFDYLLVVTILLNVLATIVETFDVVAPIENICKCCIGITTIFFIIEYILRIWTAEYLYPKYNFRFKARLRFIVSLEGIIDLLTILPVFFLSGFVVFRILRVVRIFKLFQLNTKYDSFSAIINVIILKKNQLLSSILILTILMLASSLCMYSVEHEVQPDVFSNAFSGIWWSMSTLLTVGYGDIYPITTFGRMLAICIAFIGVCVVAIPTGIISAGFVEQYQRQSSIKIDGNITPKDIAEVIVTNRLDGKTVEELKEFGYLDIYLIVRNNYSIVPTEDTVVMMNDLIISKV